MIWQCFEYIATIIEYLIYTDFMIKFLDVKKKNKFLCYMIIFVLNTLLTTIFNSFMNYEGVLCVIRITMNFFIALGLLNGSIFEKVFSAIILDITALIASYISLSLIGLLTGNTIEQMIEIRGIIRLIVIFIAKVVLFEITRIILRIKGAKKFNFEFNETLIISIIFTITLIVALGIFRVDMNTGIPTDSPLSIFIGSGLVGINILIYYLMKKISDKNTEREELLLNKAQNEVFNSQITEFEIQYNEMRKIRHDMKNHMQCLSSLISKQNDEKALEYINDIIENKLDFVGNYINTGNKIVDTVINMKMMQCRKENIKTVVHINKFDTFVEDTDMCALLSNILDNAIEASCKEKEHREIQIEIMPKKGYVNFIIKNEIAHSVLENNPELKSTKSDTIFHGIGMRSVKDTVNKYDGMIDFFEKNNFFVADVWLPLKEQKTCKLGK